MADEADSKSVGGNVVRVRVPLPAVLGRGEKLLFFFWGEQGLLFFYPAGN